MHNPYLFLSNVYEKIIMMNMGEGDKRVKFTVSCNDHVKEYRTIVIRMKITASGENKIFEVYKGEYESSEARRLVSSFNDCLRRIYMIIGNIKTDTYYLTICRDCSLISMTTQNRRGDRRCKYCTKKAVKISMLESEITIKDKKLKPVYLYLMKSELTGLLKIGISGNPKKRRRTLETAQGGKIEIVHLMKGLNNLEKDLHRLFSHHRTDGEWFNDVEEIRNYFNNLANDNT